MTKFRNIIALALGAAALAACGDSGQTDITAPAAGARVLFYNFAVGSPGVNFYSDTAKVTAVGSSSGSVSTVGVTYGNVAAGGFYTAIAPGQHTLSAHLSDASGAQVSSASATLADGKWYSYYQSGVYDSTAHTADGFVVEDPIPDSVDYSKSYVRFVNAIYNAAPGTLTVTNNDSTAATFVVGSAVNYENASDYVAVTPGTYNLSVAGLGATPVTRTGSSAVALNAGRYYTITARGDMTGTTTSTKPTLDYSSNR